MKKIVTSLLLWTLGLTAVQAGATAPQQRFANSEVSAEVSRTVPPAEGRPGMTDLQTRKIANPGTPFIARPAAMQHIGTESVMRAAAAPKQVSASLNVYGTVIYSNSWTSQENIAYGVYKIPVADGPVSTMLFKVNKDPMYSFFDGDHTLYTMYKLAYGDWVMGYDLYKYNTETNQSAGVIEFDELPLEAPDVAYDPVTGKVYGYFSGTYYGEIYRYWGYLDITSKKVVSIANMDFSLRGVAIDKFGQAYGVSMDGDLYKIDKEKGTFTKVGATGAPKLQYISSAAYNDKDNNILLTFSNDDATSSGGLVAIDPATAQSTVVANFSGGEEVIGLYVPQQAPDKAPAVPVFEVACPEGSMTAAFTLTMPDKLYDGTDAAGQQMGYKIYANGSEILNGTSTGGSKVSLTKAMTESGNTDFVAVATNDAGESNQAKASCYIGKGTPAASKSVKLAYADGKFTLTWDAVTTSSDGGYVNASDIRYDVVDAEGTTVAENLNATSWEKAQTMPDEITPFSFGVVAKYDAKTSKTVMSNTIYLGHYNAPVKMDMSKEGNFSQHSIIDANDDGATWVFSTSKGTYYNYSKANAGDDWLMSPAIYLEVGKAYDFEALAKAYSNGYPEKIEIKMGNAPTVEAMTVTLVETTTLGGDLSELKANIAPTTSGEYYIGFHAVSDKYQWSLYLNSYSISSPYGATAPDAVTDLKLTPDVTGALNVAISFTTPTKTVTGSDYTGNMKLRVLCGDRQVTELTAAAGTTQTVTDVVPEKGNYTYTVESYNMAGDAGRSAAASVFAGPNTPKAAVNVKAVESKQKNAQVTLTWEDPETDVAGNPLLASNLTYNVYQYDAAAEKWNLLNQQPLTERTYTFQAQPEDAAQTFVQVLIETLNLGVESEEYAGPGLLAVGPGYKLPMPMTCLDDAKKYIIGLDAWDGCEFGMKQDGEMSSVTSQDGDGQFFYGERVKSSATLGTGKGIGDFIFGKVDLTGAKNPVFSLYTWKITETDKTKLEILVVCEGERKTVTTIDYADDTHNLWTKKVVDLAEYKDKAIQLIIRYYSDGLVYCFLDNMKFMDMPDYDINAVSVAAPKTVVAGEAFEVTATVENTGRMEATNFDVELLGNGKTVATKKVESLASGKTEQVVFEQTITMAQEGEVEYTARVVYTADMDNSNDVTPKAVTVTRQASTLPAVKSLTGKTLSATENALEWTAITTDDLPYDPTVESFENAEPFTKEYPGWTFVDRDGKPCGGPGNITVPNHTYGVDPESFMVIDGSYSSFANSQYAKEFKAPDGKQYIASLWTKGDTEGSLAASDDWAISPELQGKAQTVTFKAKNGSINYSEYLQIWYTTKNSVNPDDFELLKSFNNAGRNFRLIRTDGWGDFEFELPEGALRFAFRCISDDGMMLLIDQVSYLAADATVGLEHSGYNVYCDGLKLNNELLTTNAFTHADADNKVDHTYHVTAVYNRGESEVCDPVVLGVSGVDDTFSTGLNITAEGHAIVVAGAADNAVRIVAADGKTVFAGQGDCRVTAAPGFYMVTVGTTTAKVVVR